MSRDIISIVYICDDNYVMPTCVSIQSIYENRQNSIYDIYIIGVDLSNENKNLLKQINLSGININLLEFPNKYKDLSTNHVYVSKAALFKFDIPNILKNLDKVLYIDSDTIILGDLKELFATDIKDFYAGVIRDLTAYYICKDNERLKIKDYFNSGVMLLNLVKLRKYNISSRLLEYKINAKSLKYMDNDCFNVVFGDNVLFLGPENNYFIVNEYLYSKYLSYKIFPLIVHFTSSKPWKEYGVKYRKKWDKYYKNTKLFSKFILFKRKYIYKEKIANKRIFHIGKIKITYKKSLFEKFFKLKSFIKEKSLTPVLPSAILASEIKKSEFKNYSKRDLYYYLFENIFYNKETIIKIQSNYIKYVPKNSDKKFLDIGCGRGEFLSLLKENNICAKGIEINKLEADLLTHKGFDVINIEAIKFLKNTADIFSGISLIEVVEHLSFDDIFELISLAYNKIEFGGKIIIETLNPQNISNLKFFYLDLTHIRPVNFQTLQFMCEFVGFKNCKLVYSVPNKKGYVNYTLICEK